MSAAGKRATPHHGEVVDAVCPSCKADIMRVTQCETDHHRLYLTCLMDGCHGSASIEHAKLDTH